MISAVVNLFWRLVFWWKRRTGWLDLGREIAVSGTVVNVTQPDIDGDMNFDVRPDLEYIGFITGFGGRWTRDPDAPEPSLHCEVVPWSSADLKRAFSTLKVGQYVRVRGRWGFDGVHLGRPMWVEVPAAVLRHMPNVNDGWFEIHPVTSIEVIQ